MSSTFGEGHEGSNNEDGEADEATRNAKARLSGDLGDEVEYGDYAEPQENIEGIAEDAGVLPGDAQQAIVDPDTAVDDNYLALDREERSIVAGGDLDSEKSTPLANSPIVSPLDSGSIPDDTPSQAGSLLSSSKLNGSTSPRRAASRTPSGVPKPFERRFESRLSASPTGTPRAQSPAFLTAHSRQISLSSHLSGTSSQDGDSNADLPQAPWDVIRWKKLSKITTQAFSEAGRRNFGRPTCMAVSALIAIGTSKGLVLGFDYNQTLKIIIGQGTKATECGSVTALAIAADYSTIASGHANGHIFTWEINRPARPFLQVPPLEQNVMNHPQHPDGHLSNTAILHVGFLGTRHTALVSADAGGMAFSHLASRGLGPVTRTISTTRLLGRYPAADPEAVRSRKPSSILAFSPLPLGNVEQATDSMGLTAMLTPYLLVIVSTTPIAQTQHKSSRPKELSPHSTLSGCLAWFPAVRLKRSSVDAKKGNSDTKLVYCWSNIMTVLDVKVIEEENAAESQKPPMLEFHPRSRWRADEAIVAVQWLGRSVLGVLTISQRLLIIEDGSLQVTDSIDLLHRHIYHQDLFSHQLHTVVEQLNSEDPSLHGVVADAFFMSYKAYKGRIFLLGFTDLTFGTLSNWADRLMKLMEVGDYIAAIRLAKDYYSGSANNVTIGLPENDDARHTLVRERLLAMISASLNYTFSQEDSAREGRLRELAEVCFEACVAMHEIDYLFSDVFEWFEEAEEEAIFVSTLEPYVLGGEVTVVPPEVVKAIVAFFISEAEAPRLEELLCRLDPHSFDLDEVTILCRQHGLYDALIYIWSQALGDYVTPLIDLLSLVKLLLDYDDGEEISNNPFYGSAVKVFPFLAYSLTGRRYPSGYFMDEREAYQAKTDLYDYLFSGAPAPWPRGTRKIFHTTDNANDEPAYPYLDLLLRFDCPSFMSMLNEAFEDSHLNEPDEESDTTGAAYTNGVTQKAHTKSRQQIIEIMLDVLRQGDFDPEQVLYLDMFVARSLPKYPGQLILSGTVLNRVLQRLCQPTNTTLHDDCQLSAEYLLSAYQPPDMSEVIEMLRLAKFSGVLKSVYRSERMFTELLETYFEDPQDKEQVFNAISFCFKPSAGLTTTQAASVKQSIVDHIQELVDIDTVTTAITIARVAPELLQQLAQRISITHQRFIFLRSLMEPSLLRLDYHYSSPLSEDQASAFTEQYVQLMCVHDPLHVADYIKVIPAGDLRLDKVLPAMESSGVIDAAVSILARDGLARDAMDRLVAYLQTLQNALTGLLDANASSPDSAALQQTSDDLLEDFEKYTKVGIWLCQGQSAAAQRRPRPRTNIAQEVSEDDLELDEFLWLNLVDAVVQVTQSITESLRYLEKHPTELGTFDSAKLGSSIRSNVHQTFTTLMAATAISGNKEIGSSDGHSKQTSDHLSFLRILRAFLTRAATTAPSLADLRAVLTDIFSAYTFEQDVLSLANTLLGSDVFAEIDEANKLRQRGWRPRSQVCEGCKRRAWGTGIGEVVWDEWILHEQDREAEKARKMLVRGGGEEARRLSRGKARASVPTNAHREQTEREETRRLALIVFACRHVFHRVCLDEEYREGKPLRRELYKCPLCIEQT